MPIVRAGQQERREGEPRRRPRGAGEALGGQPPEPHREHHDQHHPGPHHRHGGQALSAHRERGAVTAPSSHRRKHPERHAEHDGDSEGHDAERHGDLSLLGELRRHRRAGQHGRSEVPREHPADPVEVLRRERLVQAQSLPDRGDLFRGALRAGDQLRDIARQHPQGQEDQHACHEQPHHQQGQPRQRVADHSGDTVTSRPSLRPG